MKNPPSHRHLSGDVDEAARNSDTTRPMRAASVELRGAGHPTTSPGRLRRGLLVLFGAGSIVSGALLAGSMLCWTAVWCTYAGSQVAIVIERGAIEVQHLSVDARMAPGVGIIWPPRWRPVHAASGRSRVIEVLLDFQWRSATASGGNVYRAASCPLWLPTLALGLWPGAAAVRISRSRQRRLVRGFDVPATG
jgi:hypothetical protein